MRAKTVEFKQSGDPYHKMRIGKKAQIEKWFETWAPDTKYEIGDDYEINVGGSLNLRNTKITKLPNDLRVGGSLDLRDTKITELPDGLSVGGYLDLQGTKITELPNDLIVKGKIYKDF